MNPPGFTLAREFEAALAWWQAAGGDCDYRDDATAWLAEAPAAPAPSSGDKRAPLPGQFAASQALTGDTKAMPTRTAPSAPNRTPQRRDLLGESPPADLAAFRDWWMNAPELHGARLNPRVAPRGPGGAGLMVLVPQPEASDRERLLDGPQGRLLANILAAIGLDESAVYIASALPCHTPMADLPALAASGMDAVTAHHIALAAPRQLLVLGTALAPMLEAQWADGLREINHSSGKVPVMVSETLEAMMDMPRLKARFWRRWMEWSA